MRVPIESEQIIWPERFTIRIFMRLIARLNGVWMLQKEAGRMGNREPPACLVSYKWGWIPICEHLIAT